MKITLGFSPCPNDTFIFDALVNRKIDTGVLEFDVVLEDVQTLNEMALQGNLMFSKISYGVLPLVLPNYWVLNSGGALGKGVGPLLIAKKQIDIATIDSLRIAIPGENTTAHLLFSMAFPNAQLKQFMLFHEIESAVLDGTVDAGVIIHENRFTYAEKGLKQLMDLGAFWEQQLQVPIPLGGIVAKRNIDVQLVQQVDTFIAASIDFAFANYPALPNYVQKHAQEMSEAVMRKHIDLYVNNFSKDISTDGKLAVNQLLKTYQQINGITFFTNKVFVPKHT
ncbi:MAG: 1,4-dihydroxy-6-naphthoate synthase [Chitinophagaceae bacterium]